MLGIKTKEQKEAEKLEENHQKHVQAMNDEGGPYFTEYLKLLSKYRHKNINPDVENGFEYMFRTVLKSVDFARENIRDDSVNVGSWINYTDRRSSNDFFSFYKFSSFDEIKFEDKLENSFEPLTTIVVTDKDNPNYFVLLAHAGKRGEGVTALQRNIAEGIGGVSRKFGNNLVMGWYRLFVECNKDNSYHSCNCDGLKRRDHWTRGQAYDHNLDYLERLVKGATQFQKIINAKNYRYFEGQYQQAIKGLGQAFADTTDPESLINGLAAPALLGHFKDPYARD